MPRPADIPWSAYSFVPVMDLPEAVPVLDLSRPDAPRPPGAERFAIGRYDEDRQGMYEQDLFDGARTVHMGIDLGAPAGTVVRAFAAGTVFAAGHNPAAGDYGYVVVTEHNLGSHAVWALYGHLAARTLDHIAAGDTVAPGDALGWLGSEAENGGWPPHLHFQLSLVRPETHDMPGVVAPRERDVALQTYPDPRLVLGPLY